MKVKSIELQNINTTIAYENIDRGSISRDKIRRLRPGDPIITDLPDVIIVIYPQDGVTLNIDDSRVAITSPIVNSDLITSFKITAEMSYQMFKQIKNKKLIAYGFNYHGVILSDEEIPVKDYFKSNFIKPQNQLEELFGGKIDNVMPSFSIMNNNECLFSISFQAIIPDNSVGFHVNVNYMNNTLPFTENLIKAEFDKYQLFKEMLLRI